MPAPGDPVPQRAFQASRDAGRESSADHPRTHPRKLHPTLPADWSSASSEPDFHSEAAAMRPLIETTARAANATVPVLIRGESGTGKEVLARAIHAQGPRRHCRFVTIDCPALIDGLGRQRWPSAQETAEPTTQGLLDRLTSAEGGTVFLDEVGDLPPPEQARLLGFVQDHPSSPADAERPRHHDVRVIAATGRDLEADVAAQRFRGDLLFRLNTLEVRVPPLRERPEDILPLARRFLANFARHSGRAGMTFSEEAESVLLAYAWPGNVRELRNAVERAVILGRSPVLEPAAFPERVAGARDAGPRIGGPFTLDQLERAHITAVLARVRTMDEAATLLGIDASTLWRKRRRFEGRGRASPAR